MKANKGNITKKGVYHTVDIEVAKAFAATAKKKCINKSQLIESFLRQWTKDNS